MYNMYYKSGFHINRIISFAKIYYFVEKSLKKFFK